MKEREPLVVGGLVALLLLLWLGFLFHASDRFPGSLWGGVFGVSGALLMVWPLGYSAVKRIPGLKTAMTKWVPMRTLLAWHVYTGIVGAILAVLHTSHKFNNPLGIVLTGTMLVAVLTGMIGRHFMGQISQEIREKKEMLTQLELAYRDTAGEMAAHPEQIAVLRPLSGFFTRLMVGLFVSPGGSALGAAPASVRVLRLAESIADLEYVIKGHELLKRRFVIWLTLHIATSCAFYVLLLFHIWSGIHFGLRWFN